jgi:hypothetical protein
MTTAVLSGFTVLFLSLVVYGRVKFRHATLATVVPLSNERVLFDDTEARFSQLGYATGAVNTLVFLRAVVRVTNRRVLVAQPALLAASQRVIRYAVFTGPVPPDLGAAHVDGYLSFSSGPGNFTTTMDGGRRVLKIVPAQPGPPLPQYLLIESPRLDEYLAALSTTENRP